MSASNKIVRKAVFPVAGLGTRFLPITKAIPKEMLPIVDKPLIHYAVQEALEAGIEEFIFVTGKGKSSIENYFDTSYDFGGQLSKIGKTSALDEVHELLPAPDQITFTRQQEPLGLGHAVWCARDLVGNEPFAVLLADDLMSSNEPCLKQMINAYTKTGGNLVAVEEINIKISNRYGILDIQSRDRNLFSANDIIEKPEPKNSPSNIAVIGRYILNPDIFAKLGHFEQGSGAEIQLTDAISSMITETPLYGIECEAKRYDCGDKAGFVLANLDFATKRDDLNDTFLSELSKLTLT